MDIDSNGTTKRKSRGSISYVQYKEELDSDDGVPLVRTTSRSQACASNKTSTIQLRAIQPLNN